MQTHVTLDYQEHTAYLTFATEEPGKPPTIDYDVLAEFEQHLNTIRADRESLAVVVLQSSSPKYFVVGANLQALKTINEESIDTWIERGHNVFNMLEDLPLPVIAKVSGYALGGGLELAMACDFILSSQKASFGQPEAGLGFIPGWGGTFRLPARIGEARAKELMFTGKIIAAEEAYRIGLVNFVGSDEELDAYLADTIERIAQNSRIAIESVKDLLHKRRAADVQHAREGERLASGSCIRSGDTQQRLEAFFRNREKRSKS